MERGKAKFKKILELRSPKSVRKKELSVLMKELFMLQAAIWAL